MLPWADAIKYGNELFVNYPISQVLIIPAIPITMLEQTIPIGNFLLLLILFLGLARNPKAPYFIRFNTMQALLINLILLIIDNLTILFVQLSGPSILIEIFGKLIFIMTLTTVIFTSIRCLQGIEPDLPGISNAAKMQI